VTDVRAPSGRWSRATVREVTPHTQRGVRLRLEVSDRVEHMAGQHYIVRLTAEDGYTAQRSYSVASRPADPLVELYVELLDGGEVSPYLVEDVEVGDDFEVRGPIGGWFVWNADSPAVGIAGGTGVVPLIAMLRQAVHVGHTELLRLAVSSRTLAELPYADELIEAGGYVALSREDSPSGRPAGRLDPEEFAGLVVPDATYFVCGSAGFAEMASMALVDVGVAAEMIRVERFGPTA
jgi:ferredoxin-NADP reductase